MRLPDRVSRERAVAARRSERAIQSMPEAVVISNEEQDMRRQVIRTFGVLVAAAAIAATGTTYAQQRQGAPAGQGRGRGPATPPLILATTAWEDGGVIPDKYTQAAGPMAVSPELKWSQVPPGTQSFVLLMHDPEPVLNKGSKMDITHWLVWNIPGTATELRENFPQGDQPDGTQQISLRSTGYMGPGAPPGPYHHYTFELYALDTKLMVPTGTPQQAAQTRTAIVDAMDGHVLGKALLVARFHRQ
jgi:Raf kinase inhibitor-like YbhB/YbcL family protein